MENFGQFFSNSSYDFCMLKLIHHFNSEKSLSDRTFFLNDDHHLYITTTIYNSLCVLYASSLNSYVLLYLHFKYIIQRWLVLYYNAQRCTYIVETHPHARYRQQETSHRCSLYFIIATHLPSTTNSVPISHPYISYTSVQLLASRFQQTRTTRLHPPTCAALRANSPYKTLFDGGLRTIYGISHAVHGV